MFGNLGKRLAKKHGYVGTGTNMTKDQMEERILTMLRQVVDYISADAKGMKRSHLKRMAPDYIDVHGQDKEAVKAFWDMNATEQNKVISKI
jgi:hypothetical protein